MYVPNVKQDSPKHAICCGMQRFVREECLRWCVEESESSRLKLITKKRSTATGRMRERRSAGWNTRPNGGVCISIIKCVAKLGKEELQDMQGMVFVGKQTRCFSSIAAIGMAGQSVFQDGARKWSLSKKQSKAGEG